MIAIALLLSGFPATAQQRPIEHLVPIGGGYADIYAGFLRPLSPMPGTIKSRF
jgi:hypothetical protein